QRIEAEHVISELENQLDRKLTFVESLKVHNPNPDREVRKFIKGAESQIKDLEKQLAKEGARVQTLERSLTELTKEGAKLGVPDDVLLKAQGLEDPLSAAAQSESDAYFNRRLEAAINKTTNKKGRGGAGSGGEPTGGGVGEKG